MKWRLIPIELPPPPTPPPSPELITPTSPSLTDHSMASMEVGPPTPNGEPTCAEQTMPATVSQESIHESTGAVPTMTQTQELTPSQSHSFSMESVRPSLGTETTTPSFTPLTILINTQHLFPLPMIFPLTPYVPVQEINVMEVYVKQDGSWAHQETKTHPLNSTITFCATFGVEKKVLYIKFPPTVTMRIRAEIGIGTTAEKVSIWETFLYSIVEGQSVVKANTLIRTANVFFPI